MQSILVSVVIPIYNCSEFIEQAIESVINQGINFEIIAVEDPSNNSSKDIIHHYMKSYNITYVENSKRMGPAKNRNIAISKATGDYIAFLDADDWWRDEKISKQLSLIQEKGVQLVYTGRELVHHNGTSTGRVMQAPTVVTFKQLLKGNVISCSSVLMQTKVAREFPQHSDEYHEDYIMWLEILRKYGEAYGINEPLLMSRLSIGGKSRSKRKSAMMTLGSYKVMGIGFLKRYYYFICYALNGVKKYYRF
jgi:teichuronic acid biosynthesis glycosyltransferase TuaG